MSLRFDCFSAPMDGLKVLQRKPVGDERGYLERLYCSGELESLLPNSEIAQINRTLTRKSGTIRGMHYQLPPHAEIKLISCLRGRVFDVVIDLRRGSPTFLRTHVEVLSAENHRSLLVPKGFAHGFQTLTDDCELLYIHSEPYEPSAERGLHPQDPRLSIPWPNPVTELSQRDGAHDHLSTEFPGVAV